LKQVSIKKYIGGYNTIYYNGTNLQFITMALICWIKICQVGSSIQFFNDFGLVVKVSLAPAGNKIQGGAPVPISHSAAQNNHKCDYHALGLTSFKEVLASRLSRELNRIRKLQFIRSCALPKHKLTPYQQVQGLIASTCLSVMRNNFNSQNQHKQYFW